MYSASNAFHQAVKNGKPQKPLLIFSNRVFTDWDIDVETGIEFDEYFNADEDIMVGQALSNEIRFTLFNDDRSLNNFAFGEFQALLGVQTQVDTYSGEISDSWRNIGHGYYYSSGQKKMHAYHDGVRETYEFVPLGYFIAEKPNAPDQIRIDMTCYDRMQRFDLDMVDMVFDFEGRAEIDQAITVGEILGSVCSSAGVPYRSFALLNGGVELFKRPEEFDSCTMRDVLKWVAELEGTNARIDRDGYLVFDWFRNTSQSYSETDYTDFTPYWYTTERVTQVRNRTTDTGIDFQLGSGPAYLIQDNPFARSLNDEMKLDKIRVTKKNSMEKEARKIDYCMTEEGTIDYDKLIWMSENEDMWEDESKEWDEKHKEKEEELEGE